MRTYVRTTDGISGLRQRKARELRLEKKLTIDELAERLAIFRTTVYYWVRDLPIATIEKQTLAARRASRANRQRHHRLREAAYRRGRIEYPTLVAEPAFRDFVCMYIGEGYKRNRNAVSICNSDPAVVKLGYVWIRRLTRNSITFSFQYHADQDPKRVCTFGGSCST